MSTKTASDLQWLRYCKTSFGVICAIFLLAVLVSCGSFLSSTTQSRIPNQEVLKNAAFNQEIEDYTDRFLTDIVRINNYNRDRVKKVFCVAHPFYAETIANTDGRAFEAYAKLLCAEGDRAIATTGKLLNLQGSETKLTIQANPKQTRFKVIGQETTRSDAFATEDMNRIFRADILSKLTKAVFDNEADYETIRNKAKNYYQNLKPGCE